MLMGVAANQVDHVKFGSWDFNWGMNRKGGGQTQKTSTHDPTHNLKSSSFYIYFTLFFKKQLSTPHIPIHCVNPYVCFYEFWWNPFIS